MDSCPSYNRTWIEIDAAAFNANISSIKQGIPDQLFALVLKSNGYGHGMLQIAHLAQSHHAIDWLCVAGLSEALILRQNGITKPILVLSYLDGPFSLAIEHNIHCVVYDYETAYKLNMTARTMGKKCAIHLKIDTGMSRLGFTPEEIVSACNDMLQLTAIEIVGIFTHLNDPLNIHHSNTQLEKFDQVLETLTNAGIKIPCTHVLSSSGLHISPKRNYAMIRIGASAYGLIKSLEHTALAHAKHPHLQLKQILTWKSSIIQIKTITRGSFVGYNNTFQAPIDMKIAILPVGYHDGYVRALSNKGYVSIGDHLAQVVGIVSMNLMAIDVTHIPHVENHTQVTLTAAIAGITLQEIASSAGFITNAFTACISANIPRLILKNSSENTIIPSSKKAQLSYT